MLAKKMWRHFKCRRKGRLNQASKMRRLFKCRRKGRLTQASLLLNLLICCYIIVVHISEQVPKTMRFIAFKGGILSNLQLRQFEEISSYENTKSIVLYGIRKHWFTFCSFPEFSYYKYLIEFPRTIKCPGSNYSIVLNHTNEAKEITNYDIVVFTDVLEWLTPSMWDWTLGNRSEGQRWVMITEESPLYVPGVQPPDEYADKTFDWFDSYKTDSDFFHPYGAYRSYGTEKPPDVDLKQFVYNKTQLVAWMGSHCETQQWNRLKFVEEFHKLVQMGTYGKCGKKEVPWNDDKAILNVLGKYKFYLSLENSCCDEYITEKFWRVLEMGLVPVVVGAPYVHYVKFAPPHSFIHVDQFNSIAELAIFLIQLNNDDSQYMEYFKWHNLGELISYGQEEQYVRPLNNQTMCSMLNKYLNTDVNDTTKLKYFGKQWYGSCYKCGQKDWINSFMHPKDYTRDNTDIWA